MILPDSFAADLASLTVALDNPDIDLVVMISDLVAATSTAISAFAGLSLSVDVAGGPITFTLLDTDVEPEAVRSSVALPLAGLTADTVQGRLVLLATRLGSFVDLAADLTWATHTSAGDVILDQHLDLAYAAGAPSGLAQLSSFHQAVGVLVARGLSPDQARDHLNDLVDNYGHDRASAAAQVLSILDDT